MSWRGPKSQSAPVLSVLESDYDLSSSYRDILSEGQPSSLAPSRGLALPPVILQLFRLLRSLSLLTLSAASSVVAALGLALLSYLLLSRGLTPPQHLHTRTLYLDYSNTDLLAQAAFVPLEGQSKGAAPPSLQPSRFLPAGQSVDVWVELELPVSHANCRGGMAQVVAELVTADGRTASRASRPLLLRRNGWDLWSLCSAPLRWLGLVDGTRTLHVPLFQQYRDKEKTPFAVFQVAIKTRDPSWAPEILSACVKVQLRMGLLTRMLYALRPGTLLMLLLGSAALASVVGGSTAAAIFLALWIYTVAWGAQAGSGQQVMGAAGSQEDSLSSTGAEGGEGGSGSVNGYSDAESTGGAAAARWGGSSQAAVGAAAAGPSQPSMWPAAVEAEADEWQDEEPETSAAAAAAAAQGDVGLGWGRAVAGGGKAPFSEAMSTDDTAFFGSEAAGLQEVRMREGAAGLVRRRQPPDSIRRRESGGF